MKLYRVESRTIAFFVSDSENEKDLLNLGRAYLRDEVTVAGSDQGEVFVDPVKSDLDIPRIFRDSLPWGSRDDNKTLLDYLKD